MFKKAVKTDSKLRMAISGVSGSGKTYTSLLLATHLTPNKVAVIDTERGSASKYADIFNFDVLELTDYHPNNYIEAIKAAVKAGYKTIVIDSYSHAWIGEGGALDLVEEATARSKSKNSYVAWKDVTPLHRKLVDTMLAADAHIIATMRAKSEYIQTKNANGFTEIKKVGTTAVQRDGTEYEFDIVGEIDLDNKMIIEKSRCSDLKGAIIAQPGKNLADILKKWLTGVSVDNATLAPQTDVEPWNEPAEQASDLISENQMKAFIIKAGKQGWTDEKQKALLAQYGYTSRKLIKVVHFAELMDILDINPSEFQPQELK